MYHQKFKRYGSINVFIRNRNRCRSGNRLVARSQIRSPEYRWGVRRVTETITALLAVAVTVAVAAEDIYRRKEDFIDRHSNRNKKMIKAPGLPHKLKWGNRTAAKADGVEYLIGIRVVGYTGLKDVIIVEVHESVADGVGAWSIPPEDLRRVSSGDVFMKKPRAGAYYRYIKLKDIVHEES